MAESTKGAPEILAVGNAKKPAKGINVEDTVKTYWATVFSRFLRHKVAVGSIFMIVLLALLAIFADVISSLTGLDPSSQKILQRYGEWTAANPLGTDELGRDAFIRLLYGARVSLAVAMLSALASMFIGIIVGSLAGFYGGKLDTILMRVTDSFLALPLIPFLILMAAMDFGKIPYLGAYMQGDEGSILKLIIIFVSFSWMVQARLVRGAILSIKKNEYVLAARTMGQSDWSIIVREMLPNVLAPVIVAVSLGVGQNILFEAALSFLGLGIQPPTASWGNMLNNALESIFYRPSLVVIPGILILITVMSFNFLGDGLQDAMDPKANKV